MILIAAFLGSDHDGQVWQAIDEHPLDLTLVQSRGSAGPSRIHNLGELFSASLAKGR